MTPTHRHLICWRSTLAGLALAILTFVGVLALAMAFGGIGLSDGASAKNASLFAGTSIIVAMILANFAGSYYSVRVSDHHADVIGVMQGLLVGAIFSIFVLWQATSALGVLGQAAGTTLGATATMVGAAASQDPMLEDTIEDSIGNVNLKSDVTVVIPNIASRLLRGDQESAKNYLAYQAGLSPADAEQKIAAAKIKVDEAIVQARQTAATALKATGWSLFVSIVLATIASSLGGMLAAVFNNRCALDSPEFHKKTLKKEYV